MKRFGHDAWIPLLAAALIVGLLMLQPGGIMEGYDLARMHACYKFDFRAAVLAGEIPWWNPYTALGRPFLADIETATLYPPTWLVIPFGVTAGIGLIVWLHFALVIEGTRRLAEQLGISRGFAWVAGLSFALSGALIGRIQSGQLGVFCVICLWPWVWWAGVRVQDERGFKPVVCMAVWLALSFLAGSPPILWCGLIALGILLLMRSTSLRATTAILLKLTAAGMLAAGLSAVQLIPFIELVQQGNRPFHDVTFATQGGMSGVDWMTLFMPPGSWLHSGGEFNLHGGAFFFVFACAATRWIFRERNVRALAVAGIFSMVLASGDGTFVLPLIAKWIPGFAGLRYPSRYALAGILILTLLASWWLNKTYRESRLRRNTLIALVSLQMVMLIAGLVIQADYYRTPAIPRNESQLIADLKAEGLPRDGAPPRAALPSSLLIPNAGARCGISTIFGFNNPGLARTWTMLYLMAGKTPPNFHRAEVDNALIAELAQQKGYLGLSVTFTQPGNAVHFSQPAIARAFLSFASTHVADWSEAISRVREGHDFVSNALVEQPVSLPQSRDSALVGETNIVGFARNRIAIDCYTPGPALLVLAEAWFPGWTIRINEADKKVSIPVNGWMRGVEIPAGTNRVVFEYRPTWWWASVLITLIGVLATAVCWFLPERPTIEST